MSETHTGPPVHRDRIAQLPCPEDLKEVLAQYAADLATALGDNLVGAYLHGSLPRGCFHPATSDVDVIVVTERPCAEAEVAAVLAAHQRAAAPIDATFVTRSQASADETPTPVDFVLKPAGGGELHRLPQGHGDFLLQRQDAHECDAALVGAPTRDILKPVPWDALAGCLDFLFPHILPRFKNPSLMLCRIVHAFAERRLCSKKEAGEWGLGVFGDEWRPLLRAALAKYAAGLPDDQGPNEALRAFEACCAEHIAAVRTSQ